nr:Down syndrome cell adhesion molecule-like protein Dscam2 [Halyomorpha halys]
MAGSPIPLEQSFDEKDWNCDGKYHVLPTGELLVHNVEYADQYPHYKCRTRHRLTKLLESSNAVNIRISERRAVEAPVIMDHANSITVQQDEGAVLVCLAQACPGPEYRWYHIQPGYEPRAVNPGARTRLLGPVLAVEAVTEQDSGLYKCSAENSAGEASAEVRLSVLGQLIVEVDPPLAIVRMGGTAEFRCIVSHASSSHLITWFKDGRAIPGRNNGELLVVNGVTREDQGMYQCVARRAEGDTAQAAAELQLGVWKQMKTPKDWEVAIIVPIFKKGDNRECNNHRRRSLLSVPCKILEKKREEEEEVSKDFLKRINTAVEKIVAPRALYSP